VAKNFRTRINAATLFAKIVALTQFIDKAAPGIVVAETKRALIIAMLARKGKGFMAV
jgi:hypothetical protein